MNQKQVKAKVNIGNSPIRLSWPDLPMPRNMMSFPHANVTIPKGNPASPRLNFKPYNPKNPKTNTR